MVQLPHHSCERSQRRDLDELVRAPRYRRAIEQLRSPVVTSSRRSAFVQAVTNSVTRVLLRPEADYGSVASMTSGVRGGCGLADNLGFQAPERTKVA